MVKPAAMMKLMGAKNKFTSTHAKFAAFFQAMIQQGIDEGTVIEVTITKPGCAPITGNMKVQQSDLELIEDLKGLAN